MDKQQIGIIDMGSNSIRLVIYEVDEAGKYDEIQNLKVVARLSSYVNDKGRMTSEGIDIILRTLQKFESVLNNYSLTDLKGVATAAIRNAINKDEIIHEINKKSIFKIDVLSEKEEAYYGYLGVTNSMNLKEGITIDIGGGSTEITYFKDRKMLHYFSFPFGAITLKNKFIKNPSPSTTEWDELNDYIKKELKTLKWLADKNVPVIGIGGSARNLGQIHQNMISYPLSGIHQYEMEKKAVTETTEYLLSMNINKREKVDGLSKDRADIILPALAVFLQLLRYSNADKFIVSLRGLRDGLFYEKLLAPIGVSHFPNVKEESFYQLTQNYNLDENHQKRISILATFILNGLQQYDLFSISDKTYRQVHLAAHLFYLGGAIHKESRSQHTFYLLTNQSIDGFTHKERLAIAAIASFKSRSTLKTFMEPFRFLVSKEELEEYELLGAILRLCYGFDASQRDIIKKIEIKNVTNNKIIFTVYHQTDPYFEDFHASKYKKHVEKILNFDIEFEYTLIF